MRGALLLGAVALTACPSTATVSPTRAAAPPQRIVSRVVLADELLWQLGPEVRARVVSVSILADDPRHSAVAGQWPASVARTTGSGESLVALAPDLAIIGSFTNADVRALLSKAGITTLVIERLYGFDDFRANLSSIGAAVHAEPEAATLRQRFDARLAALRRPPAAEPTTVVSWADGIVAGSGTTFDDAATWVGLSNLAAQHGVTGHERVSLEQLVAWDPELIVVGCSPDACAGTAATTAGHLGFTATRAGRHEGIVAIEHRVLASTGMGMLDLVAALGEVAQR